MNLNVASNGKMINVKKIEVCVIFECEWNSG